MKNTKQPTPLQELETYLAIKSLDATIDMSRVGNLNMICRSTLEALKEGKEVPSCVTIHNLQHHEKHHTHYKNTSTRITHSLYSVGILCVATFYLIITLCTKYKAKHTHGQNYKSLCTKKIQAFLSVAMTHRLSFEMTCTRAIINNTMKNCIECGTIIKKQPCILCVDIRCYKCCKNR